MTFQTDSNGLTALESFTFSDCTRLGDVTLPGTLHIIGGGAFDRCGSLAKLLIPGSVDDILPYAFNFCTNLTEVFFGGNAPFIASSIFNGVPSVSLYYLPGTVGWADFSANTGLAIATWLLSNPTILNFEPDFGVQTNAFGFTISWATNPPVVVEASSDLANSIWTPVSTNILVDGISYFSDPQWTNYPGRYYRLRSP